jgi:hypothetical protein
VPLKVMVEGACSPQRRCMPLHDGGPGRDLGGAAALRPRRAPARAVVARRAELRVSGQGVVQVLREGATAEEEGPLRRLRSVGGWCVRLGNEAM